MIKIVALSFLFLSLIGCGKDVKSGSIEAPFTDYVASFEAAFNVSHGKTSVAMTDSLDRPELTGMCVGNDEVRTVLILRAYWEKASNLQKEQLIFHELGHCVLNLPHDASRNENGVPKSIMYPAMISEGEYFHNRLDYWNDLKSKAQAR